VILRGRAIDESLDEVRSRSSKAENQQVFGDFLALRRNIIDQNYLSSQRSSLQQSGNTSLEKLEDQLMTENMDTMHDDEPKEGPFVAAIQNHKNNRIPRGTITISLH
jgi:hypothetical protein